MKVISLNTWGGRGGRESLLEFFKKHEDVDVFCLQEIWSGGEDMLGKIAGGTVLEGITTDLLQQVQKTLPHHQAYFRPHFGGYYGLAMFVRSDLEVIEEGEIFVYKEQGFVDPEEDGNHGRNLQHVRLRTQAGDRVIMNIHGLWNGQGKGDSEDRLLQSDNIARFIERLEVPHVIVGDFNLRPDTESVAKLERCGLRNLITEYGVTSTRTSMYTKTEKFADYAFVSTGIEVKDFRVLPEEVSDHAALLLDFS